MLGAELGMGLCAAGCMCALAAGWWACGFLARREARAARVLLLLAGLPLTLLAAPWGARLSERGSWQCEVCGRAEYRETFLGAVVSGTWKDPEGRRILDAYAAWVNPLVGVHEHAWVPVGCHFRFNVVSCSLLPPPSGWWLLPRLEDQDLARRAGRALLDADPEQREEWLLASRDMDCEELTRWLAETFP